MDVIAAIISQYIQSPCCTPQTNIMIYIKCILIQTKENFKKLNTSTVTQS